MRPTELDFKVIYLWLCIYDVATLSLKLRAEVDEW